LHDEVRILIFDRMIENTWRQRPGSGSREGKLSNPRGRAARARCMKFFSKIYEISRASAAQARCASSLPDNSTVDLGWVDRSEIGIPRTYPNLRGKATFYYKWLNLLHSKVCIVIFPCCEHAAWYLLFLSLFGSTSRQYTSNTKFSYYFFFTGPDRDKKEFKK
jgi:hypothetical protein